MKHHFGPYTVVYHQTKSHRWWPRGRTIDNRWMAVWSPSIKFCLLGWDRKWYWLSKDAEVPHSHVLNMLVFLWAKFFLTMILWTSLRNHYKSKLKKDIYIQGGPQKMPKLNEYATTKSVIYEFIRAWQIWKISNIAALIIDVL